MPRLVVAPLRYTKRLAGTDGIPAPTVRGEGEKPSPLFVYAALDIPRHRGQDVPHSEGSTSMARRSRSDQRADAAHGLTERLILHRWVVLTNVSSAWNGGAVAS